MYRRILVPLDGSDLAEGALRHAEAVARRFEADLLLIQVVSAISATAAVDPMTASAVDAVYAAESIEEAEQEAFDYLNRTSQRPDLKGLSVEIEVFRGSAAPEISRRIQKGDVDLVVMSTHGRSGLGRLVFGSVADQVLREVCAPILLVRCT